ncbi:MAG: monovalent cation/H(+) antiporter subunit G [Chromatiales bacterium]|nr:MAG: monovalent cation/H(+) antiporter subunit G [Chromatiales bacterium]
MALVLDGITVALLTAGALFFVAGTIGLLRFPDLYTRLHALTKADNVGLGLVVLGLAAQATSLAAALKLIVIWLLVLLASSSVGHLIARTALRNGVRPWRVR